MATYLRVLGVLRSLGVSPGGNCGFVDPKGNSAPLDGLPLLLGRGKPSEEIENRQAITFSQNRELLVGVKLNPGLCSRFPTPPGNDRRVAGRRADSFLVCVHSLLQRNSR
jgi:hypothetical protein